MMKLSLTFLAACLFLSAHLRADDPSDPPDAVDARLTRILKADLSTVDFFSLFQLRT